MKSSVEETRDDKWRFVALPGTLLDERSLESTLNELRLLSRGATEVRIELLGQQAGLAEELSRLAQSVPEPVWWLGHSLGGIAALHLALLHPRAVAGLVLLNANARPSSYGLAGRAEAQAAFARSHGLDALVRDVLAAEYGVAGRSSEIFSLQKQARSIGMDRFERQLAYARERPGVKSIQPVLEVPVLALTGRQDRLCPPEDSQALAHLSRTGRFDVLDDSGHLMPMQQAEAVAHAIHQFLVDHSENTP